MSRSTLNNPSDSLVCLKLGHPRSNGWVLLSLLFFRMLFKDYHTGIQHFQTHLNIISNW